MTDFPAISGLCSDWSAVDLAATDRTTGTVTVEVSLTGHDGKELADDDWIGIDHSGAFCHADSAELAWRGKVRDFKALLKENL